MAASRAVGGVPERAPERLPGAGPVHVRARARVRSPLLALLAGCPLGPALVLALLALVLRLLHLRFTARAHVADDAVFFQEHARRFLATWGPWGRRRSGPGCGRRSTTLRCRGCSIRLFQSLVYQVAGAAIPSCWWRRPSWGPDGLADVPRGTGVRSGGGRGGRGCSPWCTGRSCWSAGAPGGGAAAGAAGAGPVPLAAGDHGRARAEGVPLLGRPWRRGC